MSEKNTQELLSFEFDYQICYDYTASPIKQICSKCSTKENGNPGYPDGYCIINDSLLIFECKKDYIEKAVNQLKIYKRNMINLDQFNNVFFIAYSGTTKINRLFKVFDLQERVYEMPELKLQYFPKLKQKINEQDIKKIAHDIHNIIRDNTKISNEDKPMFIGSIILGLQIPSFKNLIFDTQNFQDNELYKLLSEKIGEEQAKEMMIKVNDSKHKEKINGKELAQILIDKIDQVYEDRDITNSIQFLTNTIDVKYLFDISKKVLSIKNQNVDVLNIFFQEFCRYQNTDSKSLGIVLTPNHIIKLMIDLLSLKKDDIFLDLCTGTGSFLKQASQTCQVIGCEYQTKLYSLAKINMILTQNSKNTVYHNDCFIQEFPKRITKSAINPPYGGKGDIQEIRFIEKQIQLLDEGGLCCAIIPENIFNKSNSKQKEFIFNNTKILRIIKCNQKLFYPTANVQTCIILLQKCKQGNQGNETFLQNYTNDGLNVQIRKGRKIISQEVFDEQYQKIIKCIDPERRQLILLEDWKMSSQKLQPQNILNQVCEMQKEYKFKQIEKEISQLKKQKVQDMKMKLVKISDLFEYIIKGNKNINKTNEGKYPLISATQENNGIVKYISEFDFDGTFISIDDLGNTSLQQGKFACTNHIHLLKPKFIDNLEQLCQFIQIQLKHNYSFQYSITKERLMNEEIYIPDDMQKYVSIDLEVEEIFNQKALNLIKEIEKQKFMNQFIQMYSYKISDLFEYIIKGNKNINKTNEGKYPLISATQENNGIVKYISEFDFDGTFISIDDLGNTSLQQGKFACTNHIHLLKPKFIDNLEQLCQFIQIQLKHNYSFQYSITKERLMNETILLPWKFQQEDKRNIDISKLTLPQLKLFINANIENKCKLKTKKEMIEVIKSMFNQEELNDLFK